MKHLFILILLFPQLLFAQQVPEKKLKTEVTEVTVYLEGALIKRSGEIKIPAGKSIVIAEALSPQIDEQSIQVKAFGDFKILSVNKRLDYADQLEKAEAILKLKEKIEGLAADLENKNARLSILDEKRSVLDANKKLGGQNAGTSLSQLQQAMNFYDEQLSAISKEEILLNEEIEKINEEKGRLEQDVSYKSNKKSLPSGQIIIKVEAKYSTAANFQLDYLITNAGWYPKYDVRVKDVSSPLALTYKAQVYQNSGIDWSNVKLKLSNGNPNKSGTAPELGIWYLNYNRNTVYSSNYGRAVNGKVQGIVYDASSGEPLPGVNVVIDGTSLGTNTDLDGRFDLSIPQNASHLRISFIGMNTKMVPINNSFLNIGMEPDVKQLSEVVVTGYASSSLRGRVAGVQLSREKDKREAERITTTVVSNQTTVDFQVSDPFSITSGGEAVGVDLSTFEIDASYSYYVVPKLDNDAFLIAEISAWDELNLLEGEANLYFEDRYVGRSILNPEAFEDTLSISLGRDPGIAVQREKVKDYTKRQVIGSNKVESRAYTIKIRNQKKMAVSINLYDQLPIAAINSIHVEPTSLQNGILSEDTGEIYWELNIQAGEQAEVGFGYEVKYPKYEQLRLD